MPTELPVSNGGVATALRASALRRCWPVLLLAVILAGLVAFGVHGSSGAAVRDELGSSAASDPHLVAGTPRAIRADEWAINTPLTILQVRTGMPRFQPLIGDGTDMALSYDVPVADFWMLFRPQHWGFLVLPFDQAFAFHWWFPAAALVFGLWLLTTTLAPRRAGLGALIGVAAIFSPFLQWWFLAGTFLPEAYAVLACALFVRVLRAGSRRRSAAYAVALAWLLTCFALVLYPPFQIPCALVALAFCAGHLVAVARQDGLRATVAPVAVVLGCVTAAGGGLALFLLDHHVGVEALASSVYPGNRTVSTGGYSPTRLFSGFLDRSLTTEGAPVSLDANQSEASTPLLAGLFVIPVLVWRMLVLRRWGQRPDPVVVALLVVLGLFLVMLFVPYVPAHLTLLDRVPGNRLLLGLGMVADLLLVVSLCPARGPATPRRVVLVSFALPLLVLGVAAVRLRAGHPEFVGSLAVAGVLVLVIGAATALWATRREHVGGTLLLGVSLFVAGGVNPVSVGVTSTAGLPVGIAVAEADRADPGGWVTDLNRVATGVLVEQAVHTYSAVYNYPRTELWGELDPGGAHREYYNRYGYARIILRTGDTEFVSYFLDSFTIAIDPCSPFVQNRIRHALVVRPIESDCVRLRSVVVSDAQRFLLYDIGPEATALSRATPA